jgi:hypothetical protein
MLHSSLADPALPQPWLDQPGGPATGCQSQSSLARPARPRSCAARCRGHCSADHRHHVHHRWAERANALFQHQQHWQHQFAAGAEAATGDATASSENKSRVVFQSRILVSRTGKKDNTTAAPAAPAMNGNRAAGQAPPQVESLRASVEGHKTFFSFGASLSRKFIQPDDGAERSDPSCATAAFSQAPKSNQRPWRQSRIQCSQHRLVHMLPAPALPAGCRTARHRRKPWRRVSRSFAPAGPKRYHRGSNEGACAALRIDQTDDRPAAQKTAARRAVAVYADCVGFPLV